MGVQLHSLILQGSQILKFLGFSQLKSISTMKFLVLALFVAAAIAEPEAEAEAESRYLGSYTRAGQSYYGRPTGFYGNGAYRNGAYKTYNNHAAFPQSYMTVYNNPYFGYNNQYNRNYNGYNRVFKREAEAEPEAEPEAEAESEADAQYYGNYGQFQRRNY